MINTNENNLYNDNNEENESTSVYFKDTYVYGWGKNTYGEMGIGNMDNVIYPCPIKTFQSQIITSICSGGKHSVILTNQGKVYICGSNMFGLLGVTGANEVIKIQKNQNKFKLMTSLEQGGEFITDVACAEFHSLCLNREGHVLSWGGNLHNKLGKTGCLIGQPMRIPSLVNKRVVSISCGDYHSCALTDTGELYSWGGGGSYNRGQCGQGNLKDIDVPKKVSFFKNDKVVKVSCGGYHTIVLCQSGQLYGFGKGEYGQCGFGEVQDTSIPKAIKFNIKMINRYEREDTKNYVEINQNIEQQQDIVIKDIKCGGEHSVVLSSYGRVYTFGHGYTGQLGLGNNKNYSTPVIVMSLANKKVKQIAAGWSHTMVLTTEGNLYVAGCGKYGELGITSENKLNRYNFTLVKSASKMNISNIYAGGHHSWIVTDSVNPQREEFEMPSPLESPNYSIIQGKDNLSNPVMQSSSKRNVKTDNFLIGNNINNNNMIKGNNLNNINQNINNSGDMLNEMRNRMNNSEEDDLIKEELKINQEIKRDKPKGRKINKNIITKGLDNIIDNHIITSNKQYLLRNSNNSNNSNNQNNQSNQSKNSQIAINTEILGENINSMLSSKIQIQIAYSELNLSHRFMRFEISKNNKNYNVPSKDINAMFQRYFNKDKGNLIYRLQDDNDLINNINVDRESPFPMMEVLFSEMKNYQIYSSSHRNSRCFSLLVIYDYDKNPTTKQFRDEVIETKGNLWNRVYNPILILNEDDINNNQSESILSGWIFEMFNDFYELFKEDSNIPDDNSENGNIIFPHFLELRPSYFSSI